jgi:DNA-binding protein YbaB
VIEPASARTNALLRARVEELTEAYEWMRAETRRIHVETQKVTGRAETPGGAVVAEVGPRGQLRSLTLDPRASRRMSSEELAAAIVETVNRAAHDAGTRTAALLASILPAGFSAADLVDGTADPSTWQPERPLTEATFDEWWAKIRKDEQPGGAR